MERWRLGSRPALDGLRGLAIVFVLLAHFDDPRVNQFSGAGHVGVTVFFTLSGFLITALLLGERDRTGRFSLRNFYWRRALRLLPALYAAVLAVLVVQAYWHWMGAPASLVGSVLLSVSNWWGMENGFHGALAHTWSLGIEEQFYALWPAVMLVGLRWGRYGVGVAAAGGLVISLALVVFGGGDVLHGSVERASSLLAGCLLAVWATGQVDRPSRPWLAAAALAAMTPLFVSFGAVPDAVYVLVVPVLTVIVLAAVAFGTGPRWLAGPVLTWFGRRSYGIYLWHYPVIYAVTVPGASWYVAQSLRFVISLVVAELSWRLIETPFLRMRRHTAGDPGADGLAHRPGSVLPGASRRRSWRPSI